MNNLKLWLLMCLGMGMLALGFGYSEPAGSGLPVHAEMLAFDELEQAFSIQDDLARGDLAQDALAKDDPTQDGPLQDDLTQDDPAARADACMQQEIAQKNVHGAQMAIMRDGEMVFERAYGRKHKDRPDPVDTDTQFRIGSTTKALTAAAVMQAVDAGKIDLNAPITDYLRDFSLAKEGQAEAIRVRDLLQHTSGLHDTSAMDESDLHGSQDPEAMRRWVDEQIGQAPYAPPARFWNYSSGNYMYLGQILERVYEKTYQDIMDDMLFAPAGLSRSTLHAAKAVAAEDANFAFGHFRNPFSGQLDIYTLDEANNWARHPTGYANTNAGDLVRFANILMSEGQTVDGTALISPESSAEMQSWQAYRDLRPDQFYGLGTFVEYYEGNEMVHHDGGAWGWTATLKWIPEAGVAVATTANIGGGLLQSATLCAISAYVPASSSPNRPCELNRSRWNDFIGRYEGSRNNGDPWVFEVSRPGPETNPSGNLQLRLERPGVDPLVTGLRQDCNIWLNGGEGSFQPEQGLGMLTFIEDPVEPGVMYVRNRFYAGRREASSVEPTPTPTQDATPLIPTVTPSWVPTEESGAVYLPWLKG